MGLSGIEADMAYAGSRVLRMLVFRDDICVFSKDITITPSHSGFISLDHLKFMSESEKPEHIYADRFEFLLLDAVPVKEPFDDYWSNTLEFVLDHYEFSLP